VLLSLGLGLMSSGFVNNTGTIIVEELKKVAYCTTFTAYDTRGV